MVRWVIVPDKTALLIIDMTNDFLTPGYPMESPEGRALIPRLNQLAGACRSLGIPVIFTSHAHDPSGEDMGRMGDVFRNVREGRMLIAGTSGVELHPDLDRRPSDVLLFKTRYSAFQNTNLDALLRSRGIDTVIIGGVATNVCCESTAREAFFRDFKMVFLSDGTATFDLPDRGWGRIPKEEVQRQTLTALAWGFGRVCSVEEVLEELRPSA
ncbi:MAG: isochorismatase family cysteine hydrolase [Dehalococcoidia bacterium]|nr:isochorismatase family cysteine hydrolase [Dehalococcoidia bacterium]